MKKYFKFLSIAFALTMALNLTGVLAAGAQMVPINQNMPYNTSYITKYVHEAQLLDVVNTDKELQAAIYRQDGTSLTSWSAFNGVKKIWYSTENAKTTTSEFAGLKIRMQVKTTNLAAGGHIWAYWLPDPSTYGISQ